ncbi:alpha/beta-hydrolase [Gonapodya prolifera JEL478]|uniref:Alpha/beta-hydrolase n=1 Tax=Gonapodya prolifera (strain JEL478) TaxID=1344416 RepID=A0A139ANG5_GONPJ|nr:alpha/beta-hydrolase [Gonapodya prolifera JEL478]|eukprot:KXS18276.1 alpha/beta-hydrolase [Gonapodya prolifera JEL478]
MPFPPGKKEDIQMEGGEWVKASDGIEIYAKTWKSSVQPPLAKVLAIHGLNEHINRSGYNFAFGKLAEAGLEVHGIDMRGFGRSGWLSGDRGYSGGLEVVLKDLGEAIERTYVEGVPLFIFGHSMGGGLAILATHKYLNKYPITGVIISSPALGVPPDQALPWPLTAIAGGLAKVFPRMPAPNKIEGSQLTSVAANAQAYMDDKYVFHQTIMVGTILPVLFAAGNFAEKEYKSWPENLSIFAFIGEKDKVVDPPALKEFMTKLPAHDKKAKFYEGAVHELLHEVDPLPSLVADEVKSWILAHADAKKNGKVLKAESSTIEVVSKEVWSNYKL